MTVPNNNMKTSLYWEEDGRTIGSNATINAGDMLYFTGSTAYKYAPLDSATHAATFYGVAAETNPVVSLGDVTAETRGLTIYRQGKFEFATTSGETYYDNDLVYYGGNAQTIVKAATTPANSVGYVVLPGETTSVAGGTGVKINVMIKPYRSIC